MSNMRGTYLQLAHKKQIGIYGDRKPADKVAFLRKKNIKRNTTNVRKLNKFGSIKANL